MLDPLYLDWAEQWFEDNEPNWDEKTIKDNKWALEVHLLPYFKDMRLSEITIERIDEYRVFKQKQAKALIEAAEAEGKKPRKGKRLKVTGALGNNSINKTISRLGSSLKKPVKYPKYKIAVNAALDPDVKAKGEKPKRVRLHVEQIVPFVEAADSFMRPLVAILIGCGLRIGEACALDWCDINLSTATIFVRESKTDAGEEREVDIPLGALEELIAWKQRSPKTRPSDPVCLSGRTRRVYVRQTVRNAEARFEAIILAANKKLKEMHIAEIEHITPHGLRRTYADHRVACGDGPEVIARQGGWTDIRFVFKVYQAGRKRREKLEPRYLVAYDAAVEWGRIGRYSQTGAVEGGSAVESIQRVSSETAVQSQE